MIRVMIRRILLTTLVLSLFAGSASAQEDEEKQPDARFEHYSKPVALGAGGTALTWFMFVFVAVVGTAGLFRNARRTHLD